MKDLKQSYDDWDAFVKFKEDKYLRQVAKTKARQQKYYLRYKRRRYWLNKYQESQGCQSCGYNKSHKALCFRHPDGLVRNYIKLPIKKLIEFVRTRNIICQNCINEQSDVTSSS
jgi:hypothetical protein